MIEASQRLAPPGLKLGRRPWTAKPAPGPHGCGSPCPPLVVRILKYAATNREAKRILNEGKITVDKKVRKVAVPVGLMTSWKCPQKVRG